MSRSSSRTGKSPIVAAVLNFFFGLGYLYLGYKKILGIRTVGFVVGAFLVFSLLSLFITGLIPLALGIILAIDGYQKAQGQKGFITAE